MKNLLFANILLVLICSCQRSKDIEEYPNVPDPRCIHTNQAPAQHYLAGTLTQVDHNKNYCGYMPLGKNNYWVYLDSMFDNNGQFTNTKIDTLRFTKTYISPDSIIWWSPEFGSWKGFLNYNYSTDSALFTLGQNWGGHPSLQWAYPILSDSATYNCPFTDAGTLCKAWKLNNPVTVPAGSFNNCYLYRKLWFVAQDIEFIFCPGIGNIRFRFYLGSNGEGRMIQTSTLLSYHIE